MTVARKFDTGRMCVFACLLCFLLLPTPVRADSIEDIMYEMDVLNPYMELWPFFDKDPFQTPPDASHAANKQRVNRLLKERSRMDSQSDYDTEEQLTQFLEQREFPDFAEPMELNQNTVVDGFKTAVMRGDIVIVAFRFEESLAGEHRMPVDEYVKHICRKLKSLIKKNKYYIVAFPEYFFNMVRGDAHIPLETRDVQRIINQFNHEASKMKNVIFSFCFLHMFNSQTENIPWLPQWHLPARFAGILDRRLQRNFTTYFQLCQYTKENLKNQALTEEQKLYAYITNNYAQHVANYNVFFWSGNPLAVYRKGTYVNEVKLPSIETLGEFVYEIGDWKTVIIGGAGKDLASALFGGRTPLIIPRICGDFNVARACGLEREELPLNVYKIWQRQSKKAKLMLTSGDGAPTFSTIEVLRRLNMWQWLPMVIVDQRTSCFTTRILTFVEGLFTSKKMKYKNCWRGLQFGQFSVGRKPSWVRPGSRGKDIEHLAELRPHHLGLPLP